MKRIVLLCLAASFIAIPASGQTDIQIAPENLTPPRINGIWVQPAQGSKAQPVWGFADGIQIGIAPLPGPRGLIRIYTSYLHHNEFEVMNFIAFEPIDKATGTRGLSELEPSGLDNVNGKRFWSGNTSEAPSFPDKYYPAAGTIGQKDGRQTLTVYIFCEKFHNGADVYVRVRFTEGNPYEFEITGYTNEGSVELNELILTATMGNKARLRELYLADGKIKRSTEMWPDYRDIRFTQHDHTPLNEMITDASGGVWLIASPDENNPASAEMAPGTSSNWTYRGRKATQYWYCPDPDNGLKGVVNGRYVYWAGNSPIPGGISFENFELVEPFKQGRSYIFGITPESPVDVISRIPVKEASRN